PRDLLLAAQVVGHRPALVVVLLRLDVGLVAVCSVADGQVAARGKRIQQGPHGVFGLLVVGDVGKDADDDQSDRLVEVQALPGGGQDLLRFFQVRVEVVGVTPFGAGEQGTGVGEYQG